MAFHPLGSRVLILKSKDAEKTAGGLFLPETNKTRKYEGLVVGIGPEVKNLKVSDVVVYDVNKSTIVEISDNQYVVLEEEDIIGVFVEG